VGFAVAGVAAVLAVAISLPLALRRPDPKPVGGPSGTTWNLQLDENFSGDTASLLGSGVWHSGWFGNGKLTGPVNSEERSLFTDANISVADGRATLEVTPNSRKRALSDGITQPNLGSAINSDDEQAGKGFMLDYGYVETRMRLPAGGPHEQVWPAFWLTGHTWPDDMEIDVVEGDGTDQGCKFNIHYGSHHEDTVNLNDVDRVRTVHGATAGMHTYAADIRPDGVTFYYDGKPVYMFRGKVPDVRRFVMVDVSAAGVVTGTRSLEVDYVRAWTRG
jgi:Glycosyl hydrolases family 16